MPSGVDVDTPVLSGGAAGEKAPHSMPMNDQRTNELHSGSPEITLNTRESMNGFRHNSVEEGVEVVLGTEGGTKVVDNEVPDQNVFRAPHAVQRPRAMRVPAHPHAPPPPLHGYHGRGSWGPYHGRPPPREAYRGGPHSGMHPSQQQHPHHQHHPHPHPHAHGPYPVPPYPTNSSSGSFDDQGYIAQHPPTTNASATTTPQYSPHINYRSGANAPRGSGYHGPSDDVNVISPNHKTDPHHHHPQQHHPVSPPPRGHRPPPVYAYPPASPVSRPGHRAKPLIRNPHGMMRRPEFGRSAQREYHDYSTGYPSKVTDVKKEQRDQQHPPLVADSFDSSQHRSTPSTTASSPTKSAPGTPKAAGEAAMQQMYATSAGSWGSFDSSVHHLDDRVYQQAFPPDSPYSPYHPSAAMFSPAGASGVYAVDSFPSPHMGSSSYGGHGPPPSMPQVFSYSYDESDERNMLRDYHPDYDHHHHHPGHHHPKLLHHHARSKASTPIASNRSTTTACADLTSLMPKAAEEVDFPVADPPMEPLTPPSTIAICESMVEVNGYDVLCGRGGGTNSQVGNRRFRQLVAEFQPIYLEAKRKEKPLLARTIVLIIRKRGGRFLKKNDDTGQLFEVGDDKAEAKTSQALREGLDVRATRSAQNLSKKKKKPKTSKSPTLDPSCSDELSAPRPHSPPSLPKLHEDEVPKAGIVHPHSPDHSELRKRRRLRSEDRSFFNDFMPPRAPMGGRGEEDGRGGDDDSELHTPTTTTNPPSNASTPVHRNHHSSEQNSVKQEDDDDDVALEPSSSNTHHHASTGDCGAATAGCAGIALDVMTGAAQSSFCLGPRGWRR